MRISTDREGDWSKNWPTNSINWSGLVNGVLQNWSGVGRPTSRQSERAIAIYRRQSPSSHGAILGVRRRRQLSARVGRLAFSSGRASQRGLSSIHDRTPGHSTYSIL